MKEPKKVVITFGPDPYQPRELEERVTRKVLEILLPTHHLVMVLTKSILAERDFPLLAKYENAWFGMTVTSTIKIDDEPFASPNPLRLQTLMRAHNLGINTWVSVEPWIPDVTHPEQILEASKGFVDHYIIGPLRYEKRHGYQKVPEGFYDKEWQRIQCKFADPNATWTFQLKRNLLSKHRYA